jgi:beta-phosphoglucomutase
MARNKAVIFDLDGTIISTNWIWRLATDRLLRARGIMIDEMTADELDQHMRGVSVEHSAHLLKVRFALPDTIEVLTQERKKLAYTLYNEELQFVPGFELFYGQLLRSPLARAIATNSPSETVQHVRNRLPIEQLFGAHIYSADMHAQARKPDPALYLYVAQQLHVAPQECLVIEDSRNGVAAAKRAGMFCIGINTDRKRQALEGADLIVERYAELELNDLVQ